MRFSNARYEDAGHRFVLVDIDGEPARVAVDLHDPRFVAMLTQAVEIANAPPPTPGADAVRAEASRRLQDLIGARDRGHLTILLSNLMREEIRLLRKGRENWTPSEADRANQLARIDAEIERMRARCDELEVERPMDYRDDRHWPKPAFKLSAPQSPPAPPVQTADATSDSAEAARPAA